MHKRIRAGIAMIELILAIVVMGISLLSIPMLLSVTEKSNLVSFQQEAIAIASSHTNALLTYAWDEQNTDTLSLYIGNILHSNGNALLREVGRPAFTFPNARQRIFIAGAIASAIGDDTNLTLVDTLDDIDDFNGNNVNLIEPVAGGTLNASNEGEYIDLNISIDTTVRYGDDTATYDDGTGEFEFSNPMNSAVMANTTNIKLISTQLSSASPSAELNDKEISLSAFMCNIGTNRPMTRSGI